MPGGSATATNETYRPVSSTVHTVIVDVLMATAKLSECAAACSADNWPFYIGFALFILFCV